MTRSSCRRTASCQGAHGACEHHSLCAGIADNLLRNLAGSQGNADRGLANRATFVVDREGKIVHIEEGSGAVDPTGAETACRRVHGGTSNQE